MINWYMKYDQETVGQLFNSVPYWKYCPSYNDNIFKNNYFNTIIQEFEKYEDGEIPVHPYFNDYFCCKCQFYLQKLTTCLPLIFHTEYLVGTQDSFREFCRQSSYYLESEKFYAFSFWNTVKDDKPYILTRLHYSFKRLLEFLLELNSHFISANLLNPTNIPAHEIMDEDSQGDLQFYIAKVLKGLLIEVETYEYIHSSHMILLHTLYEISTKLGQGVGTIMSRYKEKLSMEDQRIAHLSPDISELRAQVDGGRRKFTAYFVSKESINGTGTGIGSLEDNPGDITSQFMENMEGIEEEESYNLRERGINKEEDDDDDDVMGFVEEGENIGDYVDIDHKEFNSFNSFNTSKEGEGIKDQKVHQMPVIDHMNVKKFIGSLFSEPKLDYYKKSMQKLEDKLQKNDLTQRAKLKKYLGKFLSTPENNLRAYSDLHNKYKISKMDNNYYEELLYKKKKYQMTVLVNKMIQRKKSGFGEASPKTGKLEGYEQIGGSSETVSKLPMKLRFSPSESSRQSSPPAKMSTPQPFKRKPTIFDYKEMKESPNNPFHRKEKIQQEEKEKDYVQLKDDIEQNFLNSTNYNQLMWMLESKVNVPKLSIKRGDSQRSLGRAVHFDQGLSPMTMQRLATRRKSRMEAGIFKRIPPQSSASNQIEVSSIEMTSERSRGGSSQESEESDYTDIGDNKSNKSSKSRQSSNKRMLLTPQPIGDKLDKGSSIDYFRGGDRLLTTVDAHTNLGVQDNREGVEPAAHSHIKALIRDKLVPSYTDRVLNSDRESRAQDWIGKFTFKDLIRQKKFEIIGSRTTIKTPREKLPKTYRGGGGDSGVEDL